MITPQRIAVVVLAIIAGYVAFTFVTRFYAGRCQGTGVRGSFNCTYPPRPATTSVARSW